MHITKYLLVFGLVMAFLMAPQSKAAEDRAYVIAERIISLEMTINEMLQEDLKGQADSYVQSEHQKFNLKYAEYNQLRRDFDSQLASTNQKAEDVYKQVIGDEIAKIEGHLFAMMDKSLSGQPNSVIEAQRAEFNTNVKAIDRLKEELGRLVVPIVADFSAEDDWYDEAKVAKKSYGILSVEGRSDLQSLRDLARDPDLANKMEQAVKSFRKTEPSLSSIYYARNEQEFSDAVATIAKMTIEIDEQEDIRRGRSKAKRSGAEKFLQKQFMMIQGALAAQDSYLAPLSYDLEQATENFSSMVEKQAGKVRKADRQGFAEARKYEFRDALAIVAIFAQALHLTPESNPNHKILQQALGIASTDFIKRTKGILSFTNLSLQGAMDGVMSQMNHLIPLGLSQQTFRQAILQSRNELNYYESADLMRMGSKTSRFITKTMLWGSLGGAYLLANTTLLALTHFEHPVLTVAMVSGIMTLMTDNPIKDMFRGRQEKAAAKLFKSTDQELRHQQNPILCRSVYK